MFIGPPTRVHRFAVYSYVASVDNSFRVGVPGSRVGARGQGFTHPDGLHVFPEICLDAFHFLFIQHHTGQDSGEFSPGPMPAMGLPPRMALLDETVQIDPVLGEIKNKERLLLFGRNARVRRRPAKDIRYPFSRP